MDRSRTDLSHDAHEASMHRQLRPLYCPRRLCRCDTRVVVAPAVGVGELANDVRADRAVGDEFYGATQLVRLQLVERVQVCRRIRQLPQVR